MLWSLNFQKTAIFNVDLLFIIYRHYRSQHMLQENGLIITLENFTKITFLCHFIYGGAFGSAIVLLEYVITGYYTIIECMILQNYEKTNQISHQSVKCG